MLRIGLLAPAKGAFLFQKLALDRLAALDEVQLEFVFVPIVRPLLELPPRRDRLYRWWRSSFHRAKAPLEERVQLFGDYHTMPLEFEPAGGHGIRLSQDGAQLLELLDLDLMINFHTFILRGPILKLFPHGIWSYHHGDPLGYRGAPPGFWECYDGAARSGVVLQRLDDRLDDGGVLRQAILPTVRHDYCAQRQALFAVSIPWLAEATEELLESGQVRERYPAGRSSTPVRKQPTDLQMIRFAVRYGLAKMRWQLGL